MMIRNVNDMKTREKLKSLSVRKQDKGVHISSPEKRKVLASKRLSSIVSPPDGNFRFPFLKFC